MDDSGALVSAKQAARRWIQSRTAEEQANQLVGVYTAGAEPEQVQSLTTDTNRILSAIDRVGLPAMPVRTRSRPCGPPSSWPDPLAAKDAYQANVVVMTGTGENTGGSRSAANGAIVNAGASLFAVELKSSAFSGGSLDSMVKNNGGLVLSTETCTDLGDLVESVGTTIDDQQFSITFTPSTPVAPVADLQLTVGDQVADASVVVGSEVTGATSLTPDVITSGGGISFLQGPLGMLVLVGLVLLAGIGLAYGVIMIFVKEDRLTAVLQPYDDALIAPGFDEDDGHGTSLARTALVQRAVALTEQVAAQRGFLGRTEAALERADLPLRAGEGLFFYAAVVVVATLLSLVVSGSVIVGLIVGLVAALPDRRRQLPGRPPAPAVHVPAARHAPLLAGTLRAGYSLMQGVEAVSQEVAEPMGLGAAPGGHRGPPRPPARGGARRRRRAHGQPRLRLGGHGHPHPARGRRQPRRAAADRGRDDDPARAAAPRRGRAHRRRAA